MALLLSKYEHMSYEDIATTMDLSVQAVKSLLSRARSNLRDLLQPYMKLGSLPDGQRPEFSDDAPASHSPTVPQ
jgi:RNA polymerase sigma-70 factor (ECF subfamily)